MSSLVLLEQSGALTPVSLRLPADISRDEYETLGAAIGHWHRAIQWAIGDYIIGGELLFGDDVYTLSESLGISEQSRQQYVRVALAFPPDRRRVEKDWSFHRAVIALEPDEQDAWLERAVQNGWTKRELEAQMKGLPELPPFTVDAELLTSAARQVFLGSSWNGDGVFEVEHEDMQELGSVLGLDHPSGAAVG